MLKFPGYKIWDNLIILRKLFLNVYSSEFLKLINSSMNAAKQGKKPLGFWTLFSLVVGNIMGVGIFLLPSSLAQYGSISLLAWIITLVGSLCLGFVFAELNKKIPITGGPFIYTRAAFGDFLGFAVAYTYWVAWVVGIASMALAIPGYLSVFFPALKTSPYNLTINFFIEITFVWLLTIINLLGIKLVGRVQVITTFIKIIPLLVIGILGLSKIHWHYITSYFIPAGSTAMQSLLGAMTITLYAFTGFESGTIPADDATSSRTIGYATLLGTFAIGLLYILSSFTIMGLFPAHELKQSISPFADAANLLLGPFFARLFAFFALISILGAINGCLLVQTLDSVAAARANLGPQSFTYLNKNKVAYVAFLTSGVAITLLLSLSMGKALIEQFNFIVLISTLSYLIPYFICCMAAFILLVKNSHQYSYFSRFKSLLIISGASIYSFWTMIGAGKTVVFYGCLFFFSAFPLFVFLYWKKRRHITLPEAS